MNEWAILVFLFRKRIIFHCGFFVCDSDLRIHAADYKRHFQNESLFKKTTITTKFNVLRVPLWIGNTSL